MDYRMPGRSGPRHRGTLWPPGQGIEWLWRPALRLTNDSVFSSLPQCGLCVADVPAII
jgi:hypothetical protein